MEEWSAKDLEEIVSVGTLAVFFYTPICGTCKVGERMLQVVAELLPKVNYKKMNLNYYPELAAKFEIQSVPCLMIINNKKVIKKIFAFQSVEYLYRELSSI